MSLLHPIILLALIPQIVFAQSKEPLQKKEPLYSMNKVVKIDALVRTTFNRGLFNGVVLVAEKGEIIYKKGVGLANMEWNIPNQPNTKFRIGSLTKQFTAMLVLQMVEQGKLRIDATVRTYLPNYPNETGETITLHNLL